MSVTKEQTAVEFMLEGIINLTGEQIARDEIVVERANRLFMKQIMNAYQRGLYNGLTNWGYGSEVTSEQYYNETFKTK